MLELSNKGKNERKAGKVYKEKCAGNVRTEKKMTHSVEFYGAMEKGDEKEQGDHWFILIWIMAQESNAIKWEWLLSRAVLRSLREPPIAKLDTVFVMWLGDKGTDIY